MRSAFVILALCLLTACGGKSNSRSNSGARVAFTPGPIAEACLAAGRDAANRQLCGCIQGVANSSLTSSEQSRAAEFFADPHKAQETRQSDFGPTERFWERYKEFSASARQTCG